MLYIYKRFLPNLQFHFVPLVRSPLIFKTYHHHIEAPLRAPPSNKGKKKRSPGPGVKRRETESLLFRIASLEISVSFLLNLDRPDDQRLPRSGFTGPAAAAAATRGGSSSNKFFFFAHATTRVEKVRACVCDGASCDTFPPHPRLTYVRTTHSLF